MMNPDLMYGACLGPDREVRPHELQGKPSTYKHLTSETGQWLAQYMEQVSSHPIHELHATTTAILWVMDNNCDIFFATEEVYTEADRSLAFVFPRRHLTLPEDLIKFGHPSLLPPDDSALSTQAKFARCAGDIVYDRFDDGEAGWLITFNSGRYGSRYRPHLGFQQLQNVAGLFAAVGVHVSPFV